MIGLLSLYRLLVPLLLLAMQSLAGPAWGVMAARPKLFVGACIAYFTAAVLLVIAGGSSGRACASWRSSTPAWMPSPWD